MGFRRSDVRIVSPRPLHLNDRRSSALRCDTLVRSCATAGNRPCAGASHVGGRIGASRSHPQTRCSDHRKRRFAGLPTYNAPNEQRWATIGRTSRNRFLTVVFTRRQGRIRVVTAPDATEDEKRTYRRRRGK